MRIQLAGFFLMEFLELRWREHIERAVAPAVVVERLEEASASTATRVVITAAMAVLTDTCLPCA